MLGLISGKTNWPLAPPHREMQTSPLLHPFPGSCLEGGVNGMAEMQNIVMQPYQNTAAIATAGSSNPQPDVGPHNCWLLSAGQHRESRSWESPS